MNNHIIPNTSDQHVSGTAHIDRPFWSDPTLDQQDVDEETHPDDRGVWIKSPPVDTWMVVEHRDGRDFPAKEPVTVYLDGFRHYNRPDLDWPDSVRVEGQTDPSGDGSMMLPATARRLAAAIIAATDLLEGTAETEAPAPHAECDRLPCDHAYRGGAHRSGWHNVNWMNSSDMGIEVSANAIAGGRWSTRMAMGETAAILEPGQVTRLVTALLHATETATDANLADHRDLIRLIEAELREAKASK